MSAQQPDRPPSVDSLARSLAADFAGLPHPLLVDVARAAIAAGDWRRAADDARRLGLFLLQPVINATGVVLHTNLGRAPLAHTQSARYANLELDLATGKRGSRHDSVGRLIAQLCAAEKAIVVNNNAAAVMLVLAALAVGKEVPVSRGESVEIGGAFRVPEVMAQSGAILRDVGTTNRTRLTDYAAAISDLTALTLKVHPSNYRVDGFVEETTVKELANLPVPVVADIGSGLVDAACQWLPGGAPTWLNGEPAARQSLADGAALVTFSTDKLFGGPQGGVIAGRADLVWRCAKHPLMRALRPGGLVLAALQETTMAYLRRTAAETVPFWRMVSTPVDALEQRARSLGVGTPTAMDALPGAGSLPGVTVPSFGVVLAGDLTDTLRRTRPVPILARVRDGQTFVDLRTVDAADDSAVEVALTQALAR